MRPVKKRVCMSYKKKEGGRSIQIILKRNQKAMQTFQVIDLRKKREALEGT